MDARARSGPSLDGERLDARVLTTLQGLSGRLAFSGLRRVLGAHPESLARALRRLEREGLVQKVDGTYRALGPSPTIDRETDRDPRAIAQVELPPTASARALLGQLAGRWFGSLRWVGLLERPEGELLAWARRDGGALVLLGVGGGRLTVYAPTSRPADDLAESEDAGYELLAHAVGALRAPSLPAPASALGVTTFDLAPLAAPCAG